MIVVLHFACLYERFDPAIPLDAGDPAYVDWQSAVGLTDVKQQLRTSVLLTKHSYVHRLFTGLRGGGKDHGAAPGSRTIRAFEAAGARSGGARSVTPPAAGDPPPDDQGLPNSLIVGKSLIVAGRERAGQSPRGGVGQSSSRLPSSSVLSSSSSVSTTVKSASSSTSTTEPSGRRISTP